MANRRWTRSSAWALWTWPTLRSVRWSRQTSWGWHWATAGNIRRRKAAAVSPAASRRAYTPSSCPWVGLSRGLGRVGNGCEIFVSSGLGLVIWVWNGRSAKYASRVCMKLCIGYRQANLFCILIHYPYGGAIVRYMGVQLGMGWIGSWVHKFTRQWAGLGRVSYLVGWLGLGRWKQTHGQLCYISATFMCFSPFGSVVRTSIKF